MRKTQNDNFIASGYRDLSPKIENKISWLVQMDQRLVQYQLTGDIEKLRALAKEYHDAGMLKKAADIMRSI